MTVSINILLLQQVLSLLFRNQMIPLAVGVIGSFAVSAGMALLGGIFGLMAMVEGYGVWLYSLLCLGMRANQPGGAMQCSTEQFVLSALFYVGVGIIFAVLLCHLSRRTTMGG